MLDRKAVAFHQVSLEVYNFYLAMQLMDANSPPRAAYNLVPMALGKYLFPFRTQKSSPVAAIILQLRETSKVPNYEKAIRKGGFFYIMKELAAHTPFCELQT